MMMSSPASLRVTASKCTSHPSLPEGVMPETRADGLGIERSCDFEPVGDKAVAQGGDVFRSDLAAAADDGGAALCPADGEVGIGGRVEVVARVQHVHRAAVLQRLDGGEAVGVGADLAAEREQ